MKNYLIGLFSLCCLAIFSPAVAQPVLQDTAKPNDFTIHQVAPGEIKLLGVKAGRSMGGGFVDTVFILNPDLSVYKYLTFPRTQYTLNVSYLSRNLFDLDNELEFLADYSLPTPTAPPRRLVVVDEFGSPNWNGPVDYSAATAQVFKLENQFKLKVTRHDGAKTLVYNLPGTLLTAGRPVSFQYQSLSPTPNPSPGKVVVTLPGSYPPDAEGPKVYSEAGQLVGSLPAPHGKTLTADLSGLQPGNYVIKTCFGTAKVMVQ